MPKNLLFQDKMCYKSCKTVHMLLYLSVLVTYSLAIIVTALQSSCKIFGQ